MSPTGKFYTHLGLDSLYFHLSFADLIVHLFGLFGSDYADYAKKLEDEDGC